jgi:hypothetical protein
MSPQVRPRATPKDAKKRQRSNNIMEIEGGETGAHRHPGQSRQRPVASAAAAGAASAAWRPRRSTGGSGVRVPGFGITEPNGAPLVEARRTEKLAGTNQPLPPKGHELDPYVPIGTKLGSLRNR